MVAPSGTLLDISVTMDRLSGLLLTIQRTSLYCLQIWNINSNRFTPYERERAAFASEFFLQLQYHDAEWFQSDSNPDQRSWTLNYEHTLYQLRHEG